MPARERERGSSLMLMPAAVLVVLLLASIAFDSAVVFLAERELANVAAAAANDAATQALDRSAFYADGTIRLDPERARQVAESAVALRGPDWLEPGTTRVVVTVDPDEPVVTVTVEAEAGYVFARAVPGVGGTAAVDATARATAHEG